MHLEDRSSVRPSETASYRNLFFKVVLSARRSTVSHSDNPPINVLCARQFNRIRSGGVSGGRTGASNLLPRKGIE